MAADVELIELVRRVKRLREQVAVSRAAWQVGDTAAHEAYEKARMESDVAELELLHAVGPERYYYGFMGGG